MIIVIGEMNFVNEKEKGAEVHLNFRSHNGTMFTEKFVCFDADEIRKVKAVKQGQLVAFDAGINEKFVNGRVYVNRYFNRLIDKPEKVLDLVKASGGPSAVNF